MKKDPLMHLVNTGKLFLQKDEPDCLPALLARWAHSDRGSIQPTSPSVIGYAITYTYHPAIGDTKAYINYTLNIKWSPHTKTLVKMVQPHQLWHRSRAVALAAGPLRQAEAEQRINGVRENIQHYRKLALTDSESYAVSQIVRDTTKKYLHLNYDWIAKYIRKHKDRSLGGGGYKWGDAYRVDKSGWKQVFDIVRANMDAMEDHPDWYIGNEPKDGLRSRADEFEEGDSNHLLSGTERWPVSKEEYIMERCRIILFGNHMSLYTLFIPQKSAWYGDTLNAVIDELKASGEYYFPYTEGGQIYARFSDLHRSGKEFHATDGKKWESGVGTITGKYFNCMMVAFGGITHVASGQSHTSMNDTVAMIAASRHLDATKIILGDDLNIWGKPPLKTPVIEEQPYDTQFRYCLGLSYSDDPEMPRISGLKISTDRAGKMIPIDLTPGQTYTVAAGGKHTKEERLTHAMMYVGKFGGDSSLLDRLKKVPADDYISPGELLDEIAHSEAHDVIDWARSVGIDKVSIR